MKKGSRALLVVGLLALVTFVLVSTTLNAMAQKVPVVVAAQALNPGTRITADMVSVVNLHAGSVQRGSFAEPGQVVGQVIMVQRLPGDQITAGVVGESAASAFASAMDGGSRAVAIHVNAASGLSGILRPGDYVSVVAVMDADQVLGQLATAYAAGPATTLEVASDGDPAQQPGATPTPGAPQGPVSRLVLSHLRVLMVPSSFRYEELTQDAQGYQTGVTTQKDFEQGVVVLEVPVTPVIVGYRADGAPLEASPVEVVALLESAAGIHLVLEPLGAGTAATTGVAAQDLLYTIVMPPTATPTAAAGQ